MPNTTPNSLFPCAQCQPQYFQQESNLIKIFKMGEVKKKLQSFSNKLLFQMLQDVIFLSKVLCMKKLSFEKLTSLEYECLISDSNMIVSPEEYLC